jgi:hypothetical protein
VRYLLMSGPLATPAAPAPRRRGCQIVALLILLPLLVLLSLYVSYSMWAGQELKDAFAEVSRHDSRWRLEEVEADRQAVAETKNGSVVCMAAKKLMPEKWPAWQQMQPLGDPDVEAKRAALETSFQELEPQRQLSKEQIEALKGELKRAADALAEARKLADRPQGRFPINYSVDFVGTLLSYTQETRAVAELLGYDAMLRAQEGDADGSLASCRAVLNCGRAIGDEPLIISQLVRIALRLIAVRKMERTLAQGQPSEKALKQVQQLLEQEEPENLLLTALRGERAGIDRLMDALQTGKVRASGQDIEQLAGLAGGGRQPAWTEKLALRLPATIKSQRAAMLRYVTQAVEAAKLPPQLQQQAIDQLEATAKDQPTLVRLVAPALGKFTGATRRGQVELRCAIAAIAAERYRREKDQWPESLEALRKGRYLKQVPTDVFDGEPLRMRRLEGGLVIYSVGPDGLDNRGHIDRMNPIGEGSDLGCRLWDVAKRRQPPLPAKK